MDDRATTTTYDALGRPYAYEDADGEIFYTTYDLLGRLQVSQNEKGIQIRVYESPGRKQKGPKSPTRSTPLGLRDRAMLELLYATGVRRAELAGLAVFDLDVERRALMVREGKGRKDRMIPTGERAVLWCERYLDEARPELAREPDNGFLFLSVTGAAIYEQNLSREITAYVRRSGVGKPGSCHLFRHTMATLMLEGGADIRYVQQMLGHADISSTQIYTRVSLRQLELSTPPRIPARRMSRAAPAGTARSSLSRSGGAGAQSWWQIGTRRRPRNEKDRVHAAHQHLLRHRDPDVP